MIAPRRFLPSISSLRALEALDRLGSASAVAEELALTQSAISRQLQTLERQMGARMIQRSRKRLSLTPAARDYAIEIRQALQQITKASVKLQVRPAAGTIHLAILPAFGMRWLMPRLPDFVRLHPDLTLNMSTRLKPFNFAGEAFDAAIHFGTNDWPGTDGLLLRHEHILPVCAPSLLGESLIEDPSGIANLPLLHIQTRPQAWHQWFGQQGVTFPAPLTGSMYDQFSTITQAAVLGLGVALMPDYLVEQDLAAGRLVPVFGPATEAPGAYYLVWPQSKSDDPSLRLFRNWVATHAQPEDPLPR
jgi:LysR family transcriptional regulator, glycine cleavage system transcriptional activator